MSNTKKPGYPSHHGNTAITQDSIRPTGSPGSPYRSGANVHSGGAKADPDGGAPAAQPKQSGWKKPGRG